MDINIRVSTSEAIRLGAPRTGDISVQIDAAALTSGQREALRGWLSVDNVVYSYRLQELSSTGLITALTIEAGRLAQEAIQKQVDAAKRAAAVEAALQLTDIKALEDLPYEVREDKRIGALLTQLRTEAAISEMLALSDQQYDALSAGYTIRTVRVDGLRRDSRLAERESARAARHDAEAADREAQRERQQIEDNRIAVAREQQRVAWVAQYGTEGQRKRFAAGLLATEEILAGMKSALFATLDYPRYENMKSEDVCDCEYEPCHVEYHSKAAESATDEEFATMERITDTLKSLYPDTPQAYSVELRTHTGESEQCENTVTRSGILVKILDREYTFSAEYAA